MNLLRATPLRKQLVFVAVLLIGAAVWWFGAHHFVKSPSAAADSSDSPYEIEDVQIIPVEPPTEPAQPAQPAQPVKPQE